ncbi:uncharacterized protein LOC115989820 [Quercus lobata]|uniref:uncharacterized protein LOC115989820 n=1 Tax=Quercus lobata TaxID=97700 RepID=UPI001247E3DA|nr:uncharacterized protein LOC115989820 [Quercus lobata]
MSVSGFPTKPDDREPKRARMSATTLIGFTEEDKQGTIQPHDDALVVTLRIGGYDVKRVLVDQGSAVEIMYPDLYKGLNLKQEDLLPYDSPLVSFEGKVVIPRGMIRLPVQTDSEVVKVNFIVVNAYSPYTAIVARPWLHTLGAVSSTLHQKVKYPSRGSGGPAMEVNCEELEKVLVGFDPEKFFQIGSESPPQEKSALTAILGQNLDVFAWDPYEAPRVDPDFICHRLNVNPTVTPKRQAPRRPSKEHTDAVIEEVTRLKKARAIKEVFYPEWLVNTVVGYHQIPLAAEDQEKTAFITLVGNYHYKVMPFGLKNAESTYQRMMTKMFEQ